MHFKKSVPSRRIGEILIEEGLLNPSDLEKALEVQKKQGGLLGQILVQIGVIAEEQLVAALSKQLSIPFMKLRQYSVNRGALKLIPKQIAESYLFFPFDEDARTLSIAMSDPLNAEAVEQIEKRVSLRIQIFLATVSDIQDAIQHYYGEYAPSPKRG